MSTTVVTQLTPDQHDDVHIYAVITIRENTGDIDRIEEATLNVSRFTILMAEDDELDEMEFRASLASELKAVDLTLESITYASMVRIGD